MRRLEGDIGTRVTEANHQDRSVRQLVRTPVVSGMKLPDLGSQQRGEIRDARLLERARRDDHLLTLEPQFPRGDDVSAPVDGHQSIDLDAGADREAAFIGVCAEIISHLMATGIGAGRCGKWHPRQRIGSRRAIQAQGVPSVTPLVTDTAARLQYEMLNAAPRQGIADCQPGLPSPDDQRLVALRSAFIHRLCCLPAGHGALSSMEK